MRFRLDIWGKALGAAVLAAAIGIAMVAPAAAQTAAPAFTPQQYKLGSGDRMRITVFGEPTLSGEFEVSGGGSVSLPLVGEVKAQGMTQAEFQQEATRVFADGYLNKPKIAVEITVYRPFYILGEVMRPDKYPYVAGMTVMKAVATANGFTFRANTKSIFIKHEGQDEQEVRLDPSTPVQPGDTIRIKERLF